MNAIALMMNSNPMSQTTGLQKVQAPDGKFQSLIASVISNTASENVTDLPNRDGLIEMLQQFLMDFNEQTEDDLSLEQLVKQLQKMLSEMDSPLSNDVNGAIMMFPLSPFQPLGHEKSLSRVHLLPGQNQSLSGASQQFEQIGNQKEQLLQDFLRSLIKDVKTKGSLQLNSVDLNNLFKDMETKLAQTKVASEPIKQGTETNGARLTASPKSSSTVPLFIKTTVESSANGNGPVTQSIKLPKQESKVVSNMITSTNTMMTKVEQFVLHAPQEQSSTSSFIQDLTKIMNRGRMMTLPNGQTQLTIKLYPEHLGSLDVQIIQRNGEIAAKILATTANAKDLIESNLHQLRNALVGQNISVDKIEVAHHTPEWLNDKQNKENHQSDPQQQDQSQQQNQDDHADESFENWLKEMELEEV
ncbi:flagellar hook-length control protein FliK [Alkalihalobacillus sp. AL-G]|uniref:flagellar hook-length control protein FliK n=1 Tax=Alkalihalobacillus sp. AL-G TaxID=2926399 RepID=UPI002729EC9C|nr:flagellar hook-length control protein FliK [Alkalihalobacillus sp. AL-G]WLD95156.1 flagellar hook-length control protein FliK [Alkalihalobacillus sp. AL-G]